MPQQILVHKGGLITNVQLITGVGSAKIYHTHKIAVLKYLMSIAGILQFNKETMGGRCETKIIGIVQFKKNWGGGGSGVGCEPRIEGIVQFIKKLRGEGWVLTKN